MIKTTNIGVLNLLAYTPIVTFPITFRYNQEHITGTLRTEFNYIVYSAIWLVPYRQEAGNQATASHIQELKKLYTQIMLSNCQYRNKSNLSRQIAAHACTRAHAASGTHDALKRIEFWSNWIKRNSDFQSKLYKSMYKHIRIILLHSMTTRKVSIPTNETRDLQDELASLSGKLFKLSSYNYEVYSWLYTTMI